MMCAHSSTIELSPALAEDRERDLVAHCRRREVHRLLLAEQLRRAPLELEDGRILALLLVADLGIRHRIAHRGRRLGLRVGAEVDHGRPH